MKLGEWILSARKRLDLNGVEAAKLETQLLAAHVLRVDRPYLVTHAEEEISEFPFESVLIRRLNQEPLAYILGHKEFWNRDFIVNPAVLIPRQDTEVLVEAAIKAIPPNSTVIDMGTGSGVIAITLKLERPDLDVVGSDISSRALDVAQENAQRLQADITLIRMDRLEAIRKVDAVVSNPPYIDRAELLEAQVALYEPESALYADVRGLNFYRSFALEKEKYRWIGIEIGYQQSEAVTALFTSSQLTLVESKKDVQGHTRCLCFSH